MLLKLTIQKNSIFLGIFIIGLWILIEFMGNNPVFAAEQFKQGSGYQAGAYDLNAAQPTVFNWTRKSQFLGTSIPLIQWRFNTPQKPSSVSIGADGTIYFSCDDNKLYAINADGTTKWSKDISCGGGTIAISSDGILYTTDKYVSGNLYALKPDGTTKWIYKLDKSRMFSDPVLGSDGTIYVGVGDYFSGDSTFPNAGICAINVNGTKKWSYKIDVGSGINKAPAIGTGVCQDSCR